MTGEQKQTILRQRAAGLAYSQIADEIGLSLNTVKSYCRRAGLSESNASKDTGNKENKDQCPNCGKKLRHLNKTKPKKFCCDKCRRAWWNTHRDQMRHKNICRVICTHCGADFDSYSWAARKYCSHACYISARFGQPGKEAVPQ
ncbi:MAG: LuxR C-terminal-related transcriptional regulator [Oscillospiraceae bacterium]|jgi:endogenous inhibitor of DNA gyrase (YacG/DUF329 family)|nr:LuxR C-terminal-related transcriptional regulator [Oscillospiraceae bacterium]